MKPVNPPIGATELFWSAFSLHVFTIIHNCTRQRLDCKKNIAKVPHCSIIHKRGRPLCFLLGKPLSLMDYIENYRDDILVLFFVLRKNER